MASSTYPEMYALFDTFSVNMITLVFILFLIGLGIYSIKRSLER